jgi:hypothetical protein
LKTSANRFLAMAVGSLKHAVLISDQLTYAEREKTFSVRYNEINAEADEILAKNILGK